MPYCDTCDKYHTPSALDDAGHCPSCGATVTDANHSDNGDDDEPDRLPWHFKLLVGVLVVYLGYRLIQLLIWLVS